MTATSDHADASTRLGSLLAEPGMPATTAIGHRIVHGGRRCGSTAASGDAALQLLHVAASVGLVAASRLVLDGEGPPD